MQSVEEVAEEEGSGDVLAAETDHRAGGLTEETNELLPGTGRRRRTLSNSFSNSLTLSLKDRPEKGEAGAPVTVPGPEGTVKEKCDLIPNLDYYQRSLSTNINCNRSCTTPLKDQSHGSEWWKQLGKPMIWGFLIVVVLIAVVVLIVKLSNAPECKCPSCPNKWTKYDDICYFVSKNFTGWFESRRYCDNEGGSLLILNDTVQQQIEELFLLQHDHWIGLKRNSGREEWKWVNGSRNINPVRDGYDSRMNCAYINGDIGALDCTSSRPWICMKSIWSGHIGGGETG